MICVRIVKFDLSMWLVRDYRWIGIANNGVLLATDAERRRVALFWLGFFRVLLDEHGVVHAITQGRVDSAQIRREPSVVKLELLVNSFDRSACRIKLLRSFVGGL